MMCILAQEKGEICNIEIGNNYYVISSVQSADPVWGKSEKTLIDKRLHEKHQRRNSVAEVANMGRFIEHFDPCGKEFRFNFTKYTCTQIKTGVCELQDFHPDYTKGNDLKYTRCQNILLGLRDGGINSSKMLPYIHKFTCGHWACTDGQHRICVAQKMELTLKVEREDCNSECPECYRHHNNSKVEVIEID